MRPMKRGRWTPEDIRASLLLYAVSDRRHLGNRTLPACVSEALSGGATFVQLREKETPKEEIAELARSIIPLCRAAKVPFVINDEVALAQAVGADGVHVGQDDMACEDARRILGNDALVGVSVQTVAQARAAQEAGADYLGVGTIIPTPTKPDAEVVSLDELRAICAAVTLPVLAIGGITAETVDMLAHTGISGIAVVSAIFSADNPQEAACTLAKKALRIVGD